MLLGQAISYSAYNLVPTTKFDKIQITTTHPKKMINIKYNRRMIKQLKLNKTTLFFFYKPIFDRAVAV